MKESVAFEQLSIGDFFSCDIALCGEGLRPNIDPFVWVKVSNALGIRLTDGFTHNFVSFLKEIYRINNVSVRRE